MKELALEIAAQEDVVFQLNPDSAKYAEELAKLDGMKAQLAEEENQAGVNTAVYAALEGIPIAFILTTNTYELEEKIDIIAQALSAEFEKAAEVTKSLQRDSEAREKLIAELREERDAANAETYDLQSKLKNAVEQLDEERRLSKEKDEEINRLRETLSKSGTVPIKSYEDSKGDHLKALESRPAIYDLEWTDTIKKTHYTAKRAETGEQMEPFSRLTLGLYRVLEGAELERFREEYAAAEMARLAQETHNVVVPDLQFPEKEESTGGLDGDSAQEEVVGETVTRTEFEALKERVRLLESVPYSVSA